MTREYKPIENYAVIGNLQTVALVGIDASIDFLLFPLFDPLHFRKFIGCGTRWIFQLVARLATSTAETDLPFKLEYPFDSISVPGRRWGSQ